jgi:DNA-binding response OmpR family regulator
MKVGLLEDNPAILDYMKNMFTMAGHEVYPHTESTSLLQTLQAPLQTNARLPYDVLVIDILLPGELSGTDIIIRLRQWFSPLQLPIIVVSACSQAELTWLATTIPGVSTLRKPFKISKLLQLVERVTVN